MGNLKCLSKYLSKYWYLIILGPLSMIVEAAASLMLPDLMSNIVDIGITKGNVDYIIDTGYEMAIILTIGLLGGVVGAFCSTITAKGIAAKLRYDCFKKAVNFDFKKVDEFKVGDIITRLTTDVEIVSEFVGKMMRIYVRTIIILIGGVFMLYRKNVSFALIVMAAIPVLLICSYVRLKKVIPLFKKTQKGMDSLNQRLSENITGVREIKAYVREKYEEAKNYDANSFVADTGYKAEKASRSLIIVFTIVMYSVVIIILLTGAYGITNTGLKVGEVMAAITYVDLILMNILMVAMMIQMFTKAVASLGRICEILNEENDIKDGKLECDKRLGSIEFKNVSFKYDEDDNENVLSDLNFKINKGEFVAILGATASGKSSLVNLMPRFYEADKGEILIDGRSIKEYKLKDLRSKVGIVLQKSEMFSDTIEENIKIGRSDATRSEIIEASKIACCHDFVKGFKDGYDTEVAEKGASLSGGQKQRIAIARAILKRPEILIFDDSMSALDFTTESRIRRNILENIPNTTIVIIAQRINNIRNADKIIVLEGGKIEAIGVHEELLNTSMVYKEIYESQNKSTGGSL